MVAPIGPKRSLALPELARALSSPTMRGKTKMTWLIDSFTGIGPIKFGMAPEDVATHIGAPDRSRRGIRPGSFSEHRGTKAPIVRYRENRVSEIEAFYDVGVVMFRGISIFEKNGLDVLRGLEELNGGAAISVGIILFDKLGLTAGRLDESSRTEHSVTAFAAGTWDGKTASFTSILFNDR
jgi:hypothetical protein